MQINGAGLRPTQQFQDILLAGQANEVPRALKFETRTLALVYDIFSSTPIST